MSYMAFRYYQRSGKLEHSCWLFGRGIRSTSDTVVLRRCNLG